MSCFDRADRWLTDEATPSAACRRGDERCNVTLQRCELRDGQARWMDLDDCAARGLVCAPALLACASCLPGEARCDGATVMRCDDAGAKETPETTCDAEQGLACRDGFCRQLCSEAMGHKSNVGCEYWPVDLDNADISADLNAAAQQFAVVVSNPQPDVAVRITIEQDDSAPGTPGAPLEIAEATLVPLGLRVFKLGPREVDGSAPGTFNTGSHTALTRGAYRLKSSFPVVVYQFNPLDNVNVFSNDASLLKPVEALGSDSESLKARYVALGWPQTIASTDDPNTNFDPRNPTDLRAFLTVVGTRPNTRVRVSPATRVLGGGPIAETAAGGELDITLQPFDVLNLETDDFNADFTGSIIWSNRPIVVFSGSEASDAPTFDKLSDRRCCADHLEEQLDPIRTAGKYFVASVSSNRSVAVAAAGADIGPYDQAEYFRVIAVTDAGANIVTTLPGKKSIELGGRGSWAAIESDRDFVLESDQPVMLASVSASQDAAGIPRSLPGGDPSFTIIPPVEQYRSSYVFLTPDKYNFDFIRIVAPPGASVLLDGEQLSAYRGCSDAPGDGLSALQRGAATPPFIVHRCQLSFPVIDQQLPVPLNLQPGVQNDGVHRVDSDSKVGVLVDGFDAYVSYAYAAGSELEEIVVE